MHFIHVEVANEHRADLRRAADRDRRHRAARTVHAPPVDPGATRRRRASRWGSTVAAATRIAR